MSHHSLWVILSHYVNSHSPPRTTSGYGKISCPRILCLVSRQNRQLNRLLWQPTPIVLQWVTTHYESSSVIMSYHSVILIHYESQHNHSLSLWVTTHYESLLSTFLLIITPYSVILSHYESPLMINKTWGCLTTLQRCSHWILTQRSLWYAM